MCNDLRKAISLTLILAVALTSGCTASFQIGGKQNTTEQNRQAPVSNRVEQTPPAHAAAQATPNQPIDDSDEEQTQNEQQFDEEREAVAAESARLNDVREAQEAERQRLREAAIRLEQRKAQLEQQRAAQQIYDLQQRQRAEEQRLTELRNRRENEEQRLAEFQQRPQTRPVYVESPLQPRVVTRSQATISNRVVNPYQNLNPEKKKGHSTRNKLIVAGLFAGGVILGVHLSRRKKR